MSRLLKLCQGEPPCTAPGGAVHTTVSANAVPGLFRVPGHRSALRSSCLSVIICKTKTTVGRHEWDNMHKALRTVSGIQQTLSPRAGLGLGLLLLLPLSLLLLSGGLSILGIYLAPVSTERGYLVTHTLLMPSSTWAPSEQGLSHVGKPF